MKRHAAVLSVSVAALFAVASAPAAAQQVYKWTDETGRVHYSNKPPDSLKPSQLQRVEPRVSTVPLEKPDPAVLKESKDRERRERADELERERNARRAAPPTSASADAAALQRWRDQCYAERRVDCDQAPTYFYDPFAYYPPVVRPPYGRPPLGGNTAPPGFMVGPGPAGIGAQYVPAPERPRSVPATTPKRAEPR